MIMKEYVHLIHAIEGDRYLRAHNGTLYMYTDGAWRAFAGIFPVAVISRVRDVMLGAEGFLRTLPARTPRSEEGVLEALKEAVRGAGDLETFLREAEVAALGGAATEGSGWGPLLADIMSKVRATTTSLLCGKKCVPFYIEWCDTPRMKAPGFACKDACMVFSVDGPGMKQVPKSPSQNIYMFLPQTLHDPVSEVNRQHRQHKQDGQTNSKQSNQVKFKSIESLGSFK